MAQREAFRRELLDDEAWIEAELERDLQNVDPVEDSDSELLFREDWSDDDTALGEAPKAVERPPRQPRRPDVALQQQPASLSTAAAPREREEDDVVPFEALPSSFRELVRNLREWETSMAAGSEEQMQDLDETAADLERQLLLRRQRDEELPLPPVVVEAAQRTPRLPRSTGSESPEAEAEEEGEAEEEPLPLDAETQRQQELQLVQEWRRAEAWGKLVFSLLTPVDHAAEAPNELVLEEVASEPRTPLRQPLASEDPTASASGVGRAAGGGLPRQASLPVEAASPADDAGIVDAGNLERELARRIEEQDRQIEAERRALQERLERERLARLTQIRAEEEARRAEEERSREEMAMYSEELRLRECYAYEQSCRRREWRRLAAEDRRCMAVRTEERRTQKAREEALARELEVKAAMERAQREAKAAAEREQQETRRMRAADADSHRLREALVREMEAKAAAERAHREALARELEAKADAERAQREAEARATTERERRQMSAADADSQRYREACRRELEQRWLAEADLEGRRWRAMLKEAEEQAKRKAAKEAAEAEAACVSREMGRMLLEDEESRLLQQHYERLAAAQAQDVEGQHYCGSTLCRGVLEGVTAWQKAPPALRRPDPVRFPDGGGLGATRSRGEQVSDETLPVELDLDTLTTGGVQAQDLVRLELRTEGLTEIPALAQFPRLRMLNLTGNRLKSLEPLADCPLLEEVFLCQNSLTSLRGLRWLQRLAVLRASANEVADAADLGALPCLRQVALWGNRLSTVQWTGAANVVKLELFGNALTSTAFLEQLPSLTFLDLGRNRLSELSAEISQWTPLLAKLYLYENRLARLPELRLPLLTDLVLNKNEELEVLGPLGFLPSLSRLEAKFNSIKTLVDPIAASPMLQALALTDNKLASTDSLAPVFAYPRLKNLQLSDNPFAADLMKRYRPWVLERMPHLEELDNEPVSEKERSAALLAQAGPAPPSGSSPATGCQRPRRGSAAVAASRRSDPSGEVHDRSCSACALVTWCESLRSERNAPMLAHLRDERMYQQRYSASALSGRASLQEDSLQALRRRREFWNSFMEICQHHVQELRQWDESHVARVLRPSSPQVRSPGTERADRAVCKLQAWWRGVLARRRISRLRSERRSQGLSPGNLRKLVRLQAVIRGALVRSRFLRLTEGGSFHGRRGQHGSVPEEVVIRLQAVARGTRARRRLERAKRWAQEMSRKVDEEIGDCPEIDVSEFLGATVKAEDLANPFAQLRVPERSSLPRAVVPPPRAGSSAPLGAGTAAMAGPAPREPCPRPRPPSMGGGTPAGPGFTVPSAPAAPITAWATPPPTASRDAAPSAMGSPMSQTSESPLPRRARSLSSTAESAITEMEGIRLGSGNTHRSHEELSATGSVTPVSRRRQKPPGLPRLSHMQTVAHPAPRASAGVSRGGSFSRGVAAQGRGRGTAHHGASGSQPRAPEKEKVLKAQDALAEYKRAMREAEEAARRQSPDPEAVEFQSGTPNLRLLRSAGVLPPASSTPSPRARSPLRLST